MELIVKIGADQQGLAETLERIKKQFHELNTSRPESWGAATGGQRGAIVALNRDVVNQTAKNSSLSTGVMAAAAARGLSFLKTNVYLGAAMLAAWAADKATRWAWERIYGVDDELTTKIESRHRQTSGLAARLSSARDSFTTKARESRLANATPRQRAEILGAEKATVDAEVGRLQADYDRAKEDSDSSKLATKGLRGEALDNADRAPYIIALANAETKLLDARKRQLEITDQHRKALEADQTKLETRYLHSDGIAREFPQVNPAKPVAGGELSGEDSQRSFQVDALQQAGLFTGSALLMNPNFSMQQEQIAVLEAIRANTDRIGEGTFT